MMLYCPTISLTCMVAFRRFSPMASISSRTMGGVAGTLLIRRYSLSTPSPLDLMVRPKSLVGPISILSVIP